MKPPAPPQLSFDFRSRNVSCVLSPEAEARQSVGHALPSKVLDLSGSLERKQEAYTRTLYRQILDTVKHLDR